MKPKNQRLVLVVAAIVAVLIAVLLAIWGLREQASYFYTPADIAAGKAEEGRAIRLGGMVEQGSTFVADTILAKHDERYMPPQLGNIAAEKQAGKTLER